MDYNDDDISEEDKSDEADDDGDDDGGKVNTAHLYSNDSVADCDVAPATWSRDTRATASRSSRLAKPPTYIDNDNRDLGDAQMSSDSEEISVNEAVLLRRPNSRVRYVKHGSESTEVRQPSTDRMQQGRDDAAAHLQVTDLLLPLSLSHFLFYRCPLGSLWALPEHEFFITVIHLVMSEYCCVSLLLSDFLFFCSYAHHGSCEIFQRHRETFESCYYNHLSKAS